MVTTVEPPHLYTPLFTDEPYHGKVVDGVLTLSTGATVDIPTPDPYCMLLDRNANGVDHDPTWADVQEGKEWVEREVLNSNMLTVGYTPFRWANMVYTDDAGLSWVLQFKVVNHVIEIRVVGTMFEVSYPVVLGAWITDPVGGVRPQVGSIAGVYDLVYSTIPRVVQAKDCRKCLLHILEGAISVDAYPTYTDTSGTLQGYYSTSQPEYGGSVPGDMPRDLTHILEVELTGVIDIATGEGLQAQISSTWGPDKCRAAPATTYTSTHPQYAVITEESYGYDNSLTREVWTTRGVVVRRTEAVSILYAYYEDDGSVTIVDVVYTDRSSTYSDNKTRVYRGFYGNDYEKVSEVLDVHNTYTSLFRERGAELHEKVTEYRVQVANLWGWAQVDNPGGVLEWVQTSAGDYLNPEGEGYWSSTHAAWVVVSSTGSKTLQVDGVDIDMSPESGAGDGMVRRYYRPYLIGDRMLTFHRVPNPVLYPDWWTPPAAWDNPTEPISATILPWRQHLLTHTHKIMGEVPEYAVRNPHTGLIETSDVPIGYV